MAPLPPPPPCVSLVRLGAVASTDGGSGGGVAALAFSRVEGGCAYLAAGGPDGGVRIYGVRQGGEGGWLVAEMKGHEGGVNDVCFHEDRKHVASASDDGTVRVWDVERAEQVQVLVGHTHYVFAVRYANPRGHLLASGSFDESVRLWDARNGACLRVLPAHGDPVTSVSFSDDGALLATASHDGLVRLWSAATGKCLHTLLHENHAENAAPAPAAEPPATVAEAAAAAQPPAPPSVCAVEVFPGGRYLLTGTLDDTVRVWDMLADREAAAAAPPPDGDATGADDVPREPKLLCVRTLNGCACRTMSAARAVMQLPQGGPTLVVGGGEDGALCVWDAGSPGRGAPVAVARSAHGGPAVAVAACPSLGIVVTGAIEDGGKPCAWRVDVTM